MSYLNMLSQFGASSAHPGGFEATLKQFEHFQISKESKILEVGCGTGRTSCFLSQHGYDITAMDIQPEMLKKARKRAEAQGLKIDFAQGDVCSIPFESNQFDILIVESVTNFADIHAALGEYYRVLKPGGTLYDREIIETTPVPDAMKAPLYDFFGFKQLVSLEVWTERLHEANFLPAHWDFSMMMKENQDQVEHPDDYQYLDPHIFTNIQAFQTAVAYNDLLITYKDYLGSALLIGTKVEGHRESTERG